MTKFVCRRDDIYAGLLMLNEGFNIDEICENLGGYNGFLKDKIVRGILFNIDEFGNANDLVYDIGISYPVLNISSKANTNYYVNHCIKLDELLKHLGYNEFLKQSDVNKIYRKFVISDKWLHNNAELFGFLKLAGGGYGEGGLEIVSSDIYNTLRFIESSYRQKNFKKRTNNVEKSLVKRR